MKRQYSMTEIGIIVILMSLLLSLVISNITTTTTTTIINNQSVIQRAFYTASLNAQVSDIPVQLSLKKNGDSVSINIIYTKKIQNQIDPIWRGQHHYLLMHTKISKDSSYFFLPTGEGIGDETRLMMFGRTCTLTIDRLTSKLHIKNTL